MAEELTKPLSPAKVKPAADKALIETNNVSLITLNRSLLWELRNLAADLPARNFCACILLDRANGGGRSVAIMSTLQAVDGQPPRFDNAESVEYCC